MSNTPTIIKLSDQPKISKLTITWNGNFMDEEGKFYKLAIVNGKDLVLLELKDDEK